MTRPFTHKKLEDVKDSAPENGLGDDMEARFATADYEVEDAGFSHHRLKPNRRQGFGHKHEEAEEVYVVIRGSGRVKLDDEIVELEELDAIRVAPEVVRSFESGDEGIELIAFGARHEGDGEVIPNWWSD